MKGLKSAAAQGVIWNLAQNVASKLLALVVFAVLARILDRSAFGAVALALAVTAFAELLVNQGYGEFITQSPSLTEGHLDTAFWLNVGVGVTLMSIIAFGAEPLARLFAEPTLTPIVRLLSLSVLIRSLTVVPTGLLTREMKFRSLSMRTMVSAVVSGAAGIAAALGGFGIYSLVIQILLGDAVAMATLWAATSWRPGTRFSRACLKDLSEYGAPIFGAGILGFASRRLDSLIIVNALGLNTLGVYSTAQRVPQIANQVLNGSMQGVAFSVLARLADSEERRRRTFYKVIEVTAALCFPAYVGLAVVDAPLVATLFGSRWADAVPVLAMFALVGIPLTLSYVHYSALKSAGRTRFVLLNQVVMATVYLPLLLLFVHSGAAAAAGAYLISVCIVLPVEWIGVRAALDITLVSYARALVGPVVASAVMAAATWSLLRLTAPMVPAAQLLVVGAAGVATYALALRILSPGTFARSLDMVRQFRLRRGSAVAADPE